MRMKLSILIAALFFTTCHLYSQQLNENLKIMEPFTGNIWESTMQGLRGEGEIKSEREWEIVWNGAAVKYSNSTEKLQVYTEGYYYWDPVEDKIAFFTLNNKGRFLKGFIVKEENRLFAYGTITLADKSMEFKNYFEFTPGGTILDTWYRFEDNEWKGGHSVELTKKR